MLDVIHIGYAKSASTLLQNAFSAHPALDMVNSRPFTRPLLFNDENVFDSSALRGLASDATDKVRILSDEGLCGWSFFYNYSRIARRLSETFPDARILILVREQSRFLESLYRHELGFGYGFSAERFIRSYCEHRNVFHGLSYDRVLAEYRGRFANVHLELMERVVGPQAEPAALESLFGFIGVSVPEIDVSAPANQGMTALSTGLTHVINRLSGSKLQMFDRTRIYNAWRYRWSRRVDRLARIGGRTASYSFPAEIAADIRRRFAVNNKALAEALGVDVGRWGYAVD